LSQFPSELIPTDKLIEKLGFQCSSPDSLFHSLLLFSGCLFFCLLCSLSFSHGTLFCLTFLPVYPSPRGSLVLPEEGERRFDGGKYHLVARLHRSEDVGNLFLVEWR
jgi:hypothetical protein